MSISHFENWILQLSPIYRTKGINLALLIAALFFSSLSVANEFATSSAWLNQMFYSKSSSGHYQSRVNNSNFFVHPEGMKNPAQELAATLELFQKNLPPGDSHPQCLFPSRYALLKQHFDLNSPVVGCKRLDQWRGSYDPTGLNLIYASQYISNPASIFGHIFLVAPSKRQTESLWMTYNFAAGIPKQTSGLGYVWGGLTGWFQGDFSILPYYQRLFQYRNIENRDLWSFQLRLTDRERDKTLLHLWELVHLAKFRYFFMDENCAGVLLRLFAANLEGVGNMSSLSLYVSPIEVVQKLHETNRIESTKWIPSSYHRVKRKLLWLSSDQRSKFYTAISNPNQALQTEDIKVVETLIDYLFYLTNKNEGELPQKFKPLERSSYIARAKSPAPPIQIAMDRIQEKSPAFAHKPYSVDFAYSKLNSTSVFDFGFRFLMHDMLDPEPGFIRNSTVESLDFRLSYREKDFWLRSLTLFKMENIQPIWWFSPQHSWRAELGWQENWFTADNVFDKHFVGDFAYGGALEAGLHTVYLMANPVLNVGSVASQGAFEVGPELGWIYSKSRFKIIVKGRQLQSVFDDESTKRLEISSGLRYQLHDQLSLLQEARWSRLLPYDLEAHRIDLGIRVYF